MSDPSPIQASSKLKLEDLVGSGHQILPFTAPFFAIGLALNILFPAAFRVGGPAPVLRAASWLGLILGVTVWWWSVALILTKARRGELVTTGPYALVKHPIYTSVGLLVIPSFCLLLNTWLGVPVGLALYAGARIYAPAEEEKLSKTFGPAWDDYRRRVKIPWV